MELPVYVRSIIDQNVIMWRMTVYLWIWVHLAGIIVIYITAEVCSNA